MIAVLCPSRDSVAGAERAYQSMLDTSRDADLILCADEDQRERYAGFGKRPRARLFARPRQSVVDLLNAAVLSLPGYAAYGLIVDDAVFTVTGWDEFVAGQIADFRGGIGVVSAHHADGPWVNFPYVGPRWIETLGWYACPETHHFCWDTVLELLGDATAITYAHEDEFSIHHDSLARPGVKERFQHDGKAFLSWCIDQRRWNIAALREARDTSL